MRIRVTASAVAIAITAVVASSAHAATFNIPCGDTAALNNAISTANTTTTPDTIELAPCTYTVTIPAVVSGGNNYAVPVVTQPLTIDGNGSTLERSTSATVPFRLLGTISSLTVNDLTLKGGAVTASGQGGGAIAAVLPATQTLALNRDIITGNSTGAANGSGGAVGQIGGNLAVNNTKFTSNASKANGGAIFAQNVATTIVNSVFGDGTKDGTNAAGVGGGLYTTGGTIDVTHSFFFGNTALVAGGTSTVSTSGAIRRSSYVLNVADNTAGALVTGGTVTFENDTFGVNTAGWFGISNPNNIGGIAVANNGATAGVANVASSTFADSGRTTDPSPGASLVTVGTGVINVTDTIVTDTNSTVATPPTGTGNYKQCDTSLGGTINNQGGNIQWPQNTCNFGTVADPLLGALDTTNLVYPLQPGSPAIDLGGATGPAVDELGNPRPSGEGFDAGAVEAQIPDTTIDPVPSPTNAPVINAHSSIPGSTFECKVDSGDFAACTMPFSPALSDGQHTVAVRAVSNGYRDATPATVTFTVDRTPPVVNITSGPSGNTTATSATFTYTVDDPNATVECRLDSQPFAPCTSPTTVSGYGLGSHTFEVRATDAAGNVGSATRTFTRVESDVTPPETTITSGPSGTIYDQPSSTFTFTSNEPGSTFECRLDGGAFAPCTSPKTVSYAPGTHTFEVRATDPSGNVDATPASRTFTYVNCTLVRITLPLGGTPIVICI